MPAAGELLTLQFGPYSNHIGAHYWNAQDELNSPAFAPAAGGLPELDADVLYRTWGSGGGAVYAPRVLVFDTRSSAGMAQAAAAWAGSAAGGGGGGGGGEVGSLPLPLRRRPLHTQHAFQRYLQRIEEGEGCGGAADASSSLPSESDPESAGVCSWGDYLKALLPPASLVPLGGRSSTGEQLGSAAAGDITGDTPFDAFTLGGGLANEALLDVLRRSLEACDRLQGLQALVDVDSGWGGLAAEVLSAAREELPRAALLVLGCVPPAPRAGGGAGGVLRAYEGAARGRAGVRALNLGLAAATFGGGGNELGASYVPLSLGAYADAQAAGGADAAAWLPGLRRPPAHSAYHTSALLAAAWDGLTTPLRARRGGWGGRREGEGEAPLGCSVSARRAEECGGGGEQRPGRGAAASAATAAAAAALESDACAPLVALRDGASLRELLEALTPSPAHRTHTLSLALPLPLPRARAAGLARALASGPGWAPGLPAAGLAALTPLSWTSRLPEAPAAARATRPLAHALLLRGCGTQALAAGGGGYASSRAAYGRALEALLEAAGCVQARHGVYRTPLPVPLSFPASLFRGDRAFDEVGGELEEEEGAAGEGALRLPPLSVPTLTYACTGPAYAPALRRLHADFARRDGSVLFRFAGGARARGGGGCGGVDCEDFAEVEDVLAKLAEDYAEAV